MTSATTHRPVLAVTLGDVAGIGPEITAKTLLQHPDLRERCVPVVVGDADAMRAGVTRVAWPASAMTLLAGTALAFGAGWGWTGLYHLAIVRLRPHAPAAATGAASTALFLGVSRRHRGSLGIRHAGLGSVLSAGMARLGGMAARGGAWCPPD